MKTEDDWQVGFAELPRIYFDYAILAEEQGFRCFA